MNSMFKICRSLFKKNKGFSVCLFLMSLLSIVCAVLAANFSISAKSTIDNFFSYTGVPDALVATEIIDVSDIEIVKSIDGIKEISTRLTLDTNVETQDGKQLSTRLLTYDELGTYKLEFHERTDENSENPKAYVSYEFAEYNNISIGDTITLITPIGNIDVFVSSTIASVETFKCIKDSMSYYETYQFGYIYIPTTELEKVGGTVDMINELSVYFVEGLSKEKQDQILLEIKDKLGSNFVSSSKVLELESIKVINDDISTIKVLCIFIPGIVMLVSLGFSFIFLKIIIENQRKTIALLKSLGYSSIKVILIFILFTVLINLAASILGIPLGILVLRVCTGLIASANGILNISLSISYLFTIGLILAVFAIGVLASLFTSNSISKIDPSIITSDENKDNYSPKFLGKFNYNPFVKISVVSSLRKYKRLIVGVLCMAACIICMCVGFEGSLTIGHPTNEVYGNRFRYDLMIRDIDETDYNDIKDNISGIKIIEPLTFFESDVEGKNISVSTIADNSELIVLKNANDEVIFPNDGVVIDEMYSLINNAKVGDFIEIDGNSLEITGVARELAVTFFYISEQTAKDIYSKSTNCALIKIDESIDIGVVKKNILDICSYAYMVELSSQRENMDSRCTTMRIIMLILSSLSFLIGSLFVFNITIIDFNEKKTQYATLRALGASINKLSIVSIIENSIRLLLGIILAIPLSYVFVTVLLKFLSIDTAQYVLVDFWPCLLVAIGISLLYVVVSLLISRRVIRKMNFIEKLNEVE